MQENRLAIRPTMDELKTGDILAGMTDAELDARYKENPEQHALDLYVRLIPVIGEIGAKATETPPYPYLSRTFPDLEAQASSRLHNSIDHFLLRNPDSDSDMLTRLARRHEPNGSRRKLLTAGSHASVRFMSEALARLPIMYRRTHGHFSEEPEELTQIARDNYWFVVTHAKQHITDSVALRHMGKFFATPSFSVAFSQLELSEDNSLFFPSEVLDKLPSDYNSGEAKPAKGGKRKAIGCPALYSGAVHSLWNWQLTGAERVYTEQIRERRGPIFVFPGETSLSAD